MNQPLTYYALVASLRERGLIPSPINDRVKFTVFAKE
ncbi:hypothetical protein SNOG_12546 [Parastagonospora nodorum SN15]|uniref:Uncharacterized protein n=1 Tax=Phaeosphaeria nodorum (strain SN15 / ATCC MYA-4574 / FGSC 10173) TaxID=321614 RepID=Q0U6R8_PHANO|nr:hypothetical protein SNOG_12546 [Parastagonospora nodorum SN15]EAT79844.1 hypothetical protein SNOG_12546 [Parastagonospora nodorum SN15]